MADWILFTKISSESSFAKKLNFLRFIFKYFFALYHFCNFLILYSSNLFIFSTNFYYKQSSFRSVAKINLKIITSQNNIILYLKYLSLVCLAHKSVVNEENECLRCVCARVFFVARRVGKGEGGREQTSRRADPRVFYLILCRSISCVYVFASWRTFIQLKRLPTCRNGSKLLHHRVFVVWKFNYRTECENAWN